MFRCSDFNWFYVPVYGVVVFLAAFTGSVIHTFLEDWRARKKENEKLTAKFAGKKFTSNSS